jgi:DNA-binding LytR/AlgR family response regulator
MDILKCIIAEDEPLAAEIIADYVSSVPFLELKASFTNPVEALHWLMQNPTDVIFLDINMPKIKGNEFITAAKGDFQYIITTAYQEFAVDSYQWGVVDYLLKPVDFARFMIAVGKLKSKNNVSPAPILPSKQDHKLYQYFNVNKNYVKICVNDILYIESVKDYLKIVTINQSITTKAKMSDLEPTYKLNQIIRIHRSFMINLNHIVSFNHNEIFIANQSFPIGRQYKDAVNKVLGDLV